MNAIRKLIFTAVGFVALCLCGAAFAEPALDRFMVNLDTASSAVAYSPLSELQPYARSDGTADRIADTWKLRYAPESGGRLAFRIGGVGVDLVPGVSYSVLYSFYIGQQRYESGLHTLTVGAAGNVEYSPEPLLLMEFPQSSPAASDGVFTLTVEGALTHEPHSEAVRRLAIVFVPERPALVLASGTEGVVFAPSNDADYECTLPAGTQSLNVKAALGGTVASTLKWSDPNVPSTLSFARATDEAAFGKPATFSNTVAFRSSLSGTAARIVVGLDAAPDGNGGTSALKKTLKVTFGGSDSTLTLSPTALSGVIGAALSETVVPATTGDRDVLTDLKVSPASWNGLSATVAGDRILVGGVPSAKGDKTFVVTGAINGSPRAATFSVSIADSSASLILSESTVEAHVDVPLVHTVTASGANATDVLGALSVTPGEWNGLTVSASGNAVTLSGTPSLSGSGKFSVSAPVNGVVRSADFTVAVSINALSPLKLSPDAVEATVGKNLSTTIVTHSEASGDIIARVGVSPANWNGLTALVSDTKILLSGVPEGSGSQTFAVTAVVNAKACSATFRVDACAPGEAPGDDSTSDTLPVSAMPEDWEGTWNENSRAFTLSTTFVLPASAQKALRASSSASATAEFRYPDAVEAVQADASGGTFTVRGKVRSGAKLNNVILDKISLTDADGATYTRDNLALMLTQVIESDGSTAPSGGESDNGGGSSGCNGGFGVLTLTLGMFMVLKRQGR